MIRRRTLTPVWLALLLIALPLQADGPHWQVPNPDGDEEETSVDNESNSKPAVDRPKPNAASIKRPPPGERAKPNYIAEGYVAEDYMKNPGDFLKMDPACVDYYERHSLIGYPAKGGPGLPTDIVGKAKNDQEFYILILSRCAQAMRQVDNYLPCPDSFPLWHSEELRELMLEYAERTWVRSTSLKPELAKVCADFCVQCYVDTVRFRDPARDGAAAQLKAVFDGNQKLRELLEKMNDEKDPAKKESIWKQCKSTLSGKGVQEGLVKTLLTFKLYQWDIPLQVDETEMRMMLALVKMGNIVLPALRAAAQHPNPSVRTAATSVIDMIQRRYNPKGTNK